MTLLHAWDVGIEEALAIQVRLCDQVREQPLDIAGVEKVAGADLSFDRGSDEVFAGHRCDLASAIALVRRYAGSTRVPETTRYAHLFVNALRRAAGTD